MKEISEVTIRGCIRAYPTPLLVDPAKQGKLAVAPRQACTMFEYLADYIFRQICRHAPSSFFLSACHPVFMRDDRDGAVSAIEAGLRSGNWYATGVCLQSIVTVDKILHGIC